MVSNFWLISIDDYAAFVSLSEKTEHGYQLKAVGSTISWKYPDKDNFVAAVDTSLSQAGEIAQLSTDSEPDTAAFIVPSVWIGEDGKIKTEYKSFIEHLCSKLELKPLGFIAHDEAVVEQSSQKEGLPVSFIFLYITPRNFDLSLVYLGKIKDRIHTEITEDLTPSRVESILNNIKMDSTLPPQIIISGEYPNEFIEEMKNFPWIGKKTIETFLHFPDIVAYSSKEIAGIYNDIITRQFQPEAFSGNSSPQDPVIGEPLPQTDEFSSSPEIDIVDVEPSDLGFQRSDELPEPSPVDQIPEITKISPPTKPSLKLPSIRLPQIHRPPMAAIYLLPLLIPVFVILLVLFYRSSVTLFLTPSNFSETLPVILDPSINSYDPADNHFPATLKKFDINLTSQVNTSGQKTVGDQAKGQITIFNKSDKTQSIPKGSVLSNATGLKFQLTASVQVNASSANLDQGIITMGQAKANIQAVDIGPESNLPKNTQLSFKDFSVNLLQAKTDDSLSGGTKQQVAIVAAVDKASLEAKTNNQITDQINQKINSEVNSLNGLLTDTILIKHNRIEYTREVGEVADQLSAQSANSISVFIFNDSQKENIINGLIKGQPAFAQSTFKTTDFTFKFTPDKNSIDKSAGSLQITGKLTPHLDSTNLAKSLAGKFSSKVESIISTSVPRAYNFTIVSNLPLVSRLITPLRWQNISVTIK